MRLLRQTVGQVTDEDVKVYVSHLRVSEGSFGELWTSHELRKLGLKPKAKGGLTLVQLEYGDGRTFRGSARCSPRDNYCKAIGRDIAIGRALKSAADNG